MPDVTFTATAIKAGAGARVSEQTLGTTGTAGQAVYKDTDGTLKLADADAVATAGVIGLLLNGGATGQAARIIEGGNMTCDGLTKGTAYFLSPTAGGICPESDVLAGDVPVFVGIATSTTNLSIGILNAGVTK